MATAVPGYVASDDTVESRQMPDCEEPGAIPCIQATVNQPPANVKNAERNSVFHDKDSVKAAVRTQIFQKKVYNVQKYYKDKGLWQKIAKDSRFENCTFFIIAFNAVWMAVETNHNDSEGSLLTAGGGFQFVEQFFCWYFSVEIVIRCMAFKKGMTEDEDEGIEFTRMFRDSWFMFDTVLVVLMVMETWIFTLIEAVSGGEPPFKGAGILRLFRLLRLLRLMRMLRSLTELMILVKGMVTAMRTVFYVVVLLILFLYVFAIALKQLSDGTEFQGLYFFSVQEGMLSLFIYATFLDDLAAFCDAIRGDDTVPNAGPVCLFIVFIYIAIGSLTVLNMLTGVLCEVVSAVAEVEKEQYKCENAQEQMDKVVKAIDVNQDNKIGYGEFQKIMLHTDALRALEDVGVEPVGVIDFIDMFFKQGDEVVDLSNAEFMEKILELRDSNTATVKDIMGMWRLCMPRMRDMTDDVGEISKEVDEVCKELGNMTKQQKGWEDEISEALNNLTKNRVPSVAG